MEKDSISLLPFNRVISRKETMVWTQEESGKLKEEKKDFTSDHCPSFNVKPRF